MDYRLIKDGSYYSYYKVNKGDTLYQISKAYNINPKLLAYINGINEEDYIYPDDILMIPKKGIIYYITKDNDTLKTVSGIFKVDEDKIIGQNKEIYLLPGQMIFYKE